MAGWWRGGGAAAGAAPRLSAAGGRRARVCARGCAHTRLHDGAETTSRQARGGKLKWCQAWADQALASLNPPSRLAFSPLQPLSVMGALAAACMTRWGARTPTPQTLPPDPPAPCASSCRRRRFAKTPSCSPCSIVPSTRSGRCLPAGTRSSGWRPLHWASRWHSLCDVMCPLGGRRQPPLISGNAAAVGASAAGWSVLVQIPAK